MKLLLETGGLLFFKKFHIKMKNNRNCCKEEQRSLATKTQNTSLPGMFIQDKMLIIFTVKNYALNDSDALKFLPDALKFWSENLRK